MKYQLNERYEYVVETLRKNPFHDGALNKFLMVKKSDKLPHDSSFYSIRGP